MATLAPARSRPLIQAAQIEASEWGFVAATIVLVLAVTSLPYLFAYATTPAGKQYTGIMLDAPDYGQYFSWMRELAARPLAANKLTPEPNRAIFFNLLWWGLGHLGQWTGLGFAGMLQVLRVVAGSLFLLSAYLVCSWFLASRRMRRVAFLTLALTSGFGWVLVLLKYMLGRGEVPLPLDLYIAEGNTFLDILAYPHFVGAALYIVVFYLLLRGETKLQLRYAFAGGLVALFLGWQHAYDLWSVYAVLAAYAALRTLRDRAWPKYLIQSGLIVGLISWWPALYSVILTRADPVWKAVLAQFVNAGVFTPNLLQLPILLGPAFILALITAIKQNPFRLRGVSNKDLFIRGWFFVTFALIYLPVEYQIHLINGWQVPIAILATQGLFAYCVPFIQNWTKVRLGWLDRQQIERGLMMALIVCILPTNLYLWSWRFAELSRHDYPYFLSNDETAALAWLDLHVKPNDVVLSSLTIGQYVPAYTGAHAFLAHWAQTLDFFGKSQMVADFFSTSTADQRRQAILRQYGVTYVFHGPAERSLGTYAAEGASFLRPVFRSRLVVVYQVEAASAFPPPPPVPHLGVSPAITTTLDLPFVARGGFDANQWMQDGHDAQRTGYINIDPAEPWTLLWTWNGPDPTGGSANHIYDAPAEARVVTGGDKVFVPAGANGLYTLSQSTGQIAWRLATAAFSATVAYDPVSGFVYAGSTDGHLYKIDANSSAVVQTYAAGGPINRSVLLVGSFAYVVTDDGHLHKVNTADMSRVWVYAAGSSPGSGLAYSASRDVVVFGTQDLFVHAVNNLSGQPKWHVKPTTLAADFPNQFLWHWPVVADKHGIVFVRMQLDWNAGLWGYPSQGGIWPDTNALARAFLTSQPQYQNLFALNLDDGHKQFIPAVGYGGEEVRPQGVIEITPYTAPVVKVLSDGTEVAYVPFRNGQSIPPDGRWDSHMGEMVLDSTTISGMSAGDLRFVKMSSFNNSGGDSYVFVTDEQTPITLAGNTIFHAHWGASESVQIIDRSASKGLTYDNPIVTVNHPTIVRQQTSCADKNPITHWTTCGLVLFGDTRFWSGPGWWTYWNVPDPTAASLFNEVRPLYTFVSGRLLIVEGNGGDLMVFGHG